MVSTVRLADILGDLNAIESRSEAYNQAIELESALNAEGIYLFDVDDARDIRDQLRQLRKICAAVLLF